MHDAEPFEAFKQAYELATNSKSKEFLQLIREILAGGDVTLLYAAKNEQIKHVIILLEWLEKNL